MSGVSHPAGGIYEEVFGLDSRGGSPRGGLTLQENRPVSSISLMRTRWWLYRVRQVAHRVGYLDKAIWWPARGRLSAGHVECIGTNGSVVCPLSSTRSVVSI